MLTTTPFKIIADENAAAVHQRTTQKSVKGGGGLSVFHDSTAKGHGSAVKSTRKALVDVTNSTFKAARPQHATTTVKPQFAIDLGSKKPSTVQFKVDEWVPPAYVTTATTTITTTSTTTTAAAAAVIVPSSSGAAAATSSGGDDTDAAMVCSGLSMGVDEDPYDYVMRRSAEIVVTINPTCAGPDPRVEEEALIADMKAYADSLSFGGMPDLDAIRFSEPEEEEITCPDLDF